MSDLLVYIEGGSTNCQYAQMFAENGWGVTTLPEKADLIQLVGGADVSPSLYGEAKHPTTGSSEENDKDTEKLYQMAQLAGIPVTGICRGSQFLSVMGAGKLWQNVDGHATGHRHALLDVESGIVIEDCSSTHHQQHRPASNAIVIAVASPQLSSIKSNAYGDFNVNDGNPSLDEVDSLYDDVEAFYYPHNNTLGYQPHPEFFGVDNPCQMYYFDLISKYLKLRA